MGFNGKCVHVRNLVPVFVILFILLPLDSVSTEKTHTQRSQVRLDSERLYCTSTVQVPGTGTVLTIPVQVYTYCCIGTCTVLSTSTPYRVDTVQVPYKYCTGDSRERRYSVLVHSLQVLYLYYGTCIGILVLSTCYSIYRALTEYTVPFFYIYVGILFHDALWA